MPLVASYDSAKKKSRRLFPKQPMYVLETPAKPTPHLTLPYAQVARPGHPSVLQIYAPKIRPLRQLQIIFKGKIRKLILRPSTPFQLRIGQQLLLTSDHRIVSAKNRSLPRLKIRAGPAFGSGEHATTHLCLRYLNQFLLHHGQPAPVVLDLGCGSGILTLAAAKLGARSIGWDNDPTAVQEAQRNARGNRLQAKTSFSVADALRAQLPPADLIVANLYDTLLLHLLPRLEKYRHTGATLILSGILHGQENAILRTAHKLGWRLKRRGRLGRWHCLQFSS